ncbi:MAG: hypothetical protein LBC61_01640 [Candidatus Peribacteria bacterium]|jgi:hypothetical protein|nr:hypothetical protein [Candidatus Peribacteria bacterium]
MYINSLTITWIQIDKSIINYSAIEYVLNNYDIPKELLEKLLAELQKSIRE